MSRTHPIDAAAIGTVALVRLARAVVVPCVALVLTVAGWCPASAASVAPAAALVALAADPAGVLPTGRMALAGLPVVELRRLARAAGHRALARSGRRSDLLAALALA